MHLSEYRDRFRDFCASLTVSWGHKSLSPSIWEFGETSKQKYLFDAVVYLEVQLLLAILPRESIIPLAFLAE
jgi:hypothetical protein